MFCAERQRSVSACDSFAAQAAPNQICKPVKHLEGRASDGENCHSYDTYSVSLPHVI